MTECANPMELWQFAIRADFLQVIVKASVDGRKDDARRLARLALNLCHDPNAYPFDIIELQQLNNFDFPLAMEFIGNQRGFTQSKWPNDLNPNGDLNRLKRFASPLTLVS